MLPLTFRNICCVVALLGITSWQSYGQSKPNLPQSKGLDDGLGVPQAIVDQESHSCQECAEGDSCGKHNKPCLQKICDWIGYAPMRTGSTCGYSRSWKRRPDLYLYFREPCRIAAPAPGVCEPCNRYLPATGRGVEPLGDPLPQRAIIGSIKE